MLAERARRLTPSPTLALCRPGPGAAGPGHRRPVLHRGRARLRHARAGEGRRRSAPSATGRRSTPTPAGSRSSSPRSAPSSGATTASPTSPPRSSPRCGAKHTLYNICAVLVDPGDEVLVPAPYWVSYTEQVRLCEGVPVVVPTDEARGFQLDLAALRRRGDAPDQAPDPQQPEQPDAAPSIPRADLERVAALALERGLLRRLRRVLRRAVLRGARAEHRGARARRSRRGRSSSTRARRRTR